MPRIRDYLDGDADALWPLLERGLAVYGLVPDAQTTDRDLLDVPASYLRNGGRFRVLEEGRRVIGMYGLFNAGDDIAELRKMYLDPDRKGQGHGKRLLEDAIRIARDAGFRTLALETNRLLIEALGLYRKYGFRETTREQFSCRCDLAMSLEL